MNGPNVLITRPVAQADHLATLLSATGMRPVLFPTLEIAAIPETAHIRETLENLEKFQWVIFISTNAVNFALNANGGKIPDPKSVYFAAVGQTTAKALTAAGLPVKLVPDSGFNSEALLSAPALQALEGQRILIVRGAGGREHLAESLRSRGAQVEYLEVYQRLLPALDNTPVLELLHRQELHAVTITSSEALQNLIQLLGAEHILLFELPLIVVSERIKNMAATMGFRRIAVTENPSDAAILDTVTTSVMEKVKWPN